MVNCSKEICSPQIMGILNVTPDSFSDGGKYLNVNHAVEHAKKMIDEGADIIDIGGESTRPGAAPISIEEEIKRVIPILEAIKSKFNIPLSLDSRRFEVMRRAVDVGIDYINDLNALNDVRAMELVAHAKVNVCLYHCQGTPETMQSSPSYDDVVQSVFIYLKKRLDACLKAGINHSKIILDPGFGFGKNLSHNLILLKNLSIFKQLNCKILVGLSRKSMFKALLDREVDARLPASLSAALIAFQNGANIIRVHDVQATKDVFKVLNAVDMIKDYQN